jgi:phosphatidate cytidylyltransferase
MAASSHMARWITALVGLPVLAACVAFGGGWLFTLVLAVSLAGAWEFTGLFPRACACTRAAALALSALCVWLGWRFGPAAAFAAALAAFWIEEFARLFHGGARRASGVDGAPPSSPRLSCGAAPHGGPAASAIPNAAPRWLVAACVLYAPASLQFFFSFKPGEAALVLAVVMAADTGAYYAGHAIGGPKIWPSVSPKKTWAGSIGGIIASVAVSVIAGLVWGKASPSAFALMGAALCVAAQMGDFMESALKRASGVKDSGSLLPGHGGVLDRIDGLIPAVLAYALLRTLTTFP